MKPLARTELQAPPTPVSVDRPASTGPALHVEIAPGLCLDLLPDRAAWHEPSRTLFIADVHLGKAAAFRAGGVPVPDGGGAADLARLSALILDHGAQTLVILGDLLHARAGRTKQMFDELHAWRARHPHPDLKVILVRGNHDDYAGDPPATLGLRVHNEPVAFEHTEAQCPVALLHHPRAADELGKQYHPFTVALAGHLHPAVALRSRTGEGLSLRAAAFLLTRTPDGIPLLVLPAFGAFTGSALIAPRAGDRVFVLGDGQVLEAALAPPLIAPGEHPS